MFKLDVRSKVSEFTDVVTVVRDAEFFSCAKISTRTTRKLVPFSDARYLKEIVAASEEIAAVICTAELVEQVPPEFGCAISAKPAVALHKIHSRILSNPNHYWDSFPSNIHPTAQIHPTAYIAPTDVVIGEGTIVGPRVVVMEKVLIGRDCVIGANTTLGTDAYEVTTIDGRPLVIPQAGGIRIGNEVIFLSQDTVARSSFPTLTEIGDGASFDNMVHVAHDCVIGKRVKMTACSMLCGRVTLGDDAYVGPNATISNGISVGAKGKITLGAVVVKDVEAGQTVTGNFAIEHSEFKRWMVQRAR